jgi:hypothetical protein
LRYAVFAAAAVSAAALAHPTGYHLRLSLSVTRTEVGGLLVMDVDSSEQAKLLREGHDLDRDGVLSRDESKALQKKLVTMAIEGVRVTLAGYPLPLQPTDVKMSLRDDRAVAEGGLSLAVLLTAKLPSAAGAGMALDVEARAPDRSAVRVEVSAASGTDGGVEALGARDLQPDEKWTVRLGKL